MDSVAFRTWLNGIRGLDASQRGQAMRELALAEAGLPGGIHDCVTTATPAPDTACMAPPAGHEMSGGATAKPDLMDELDKAGWPASDAHIATVTTFAPGARPAENPGTAARPATRPSIR